MARKSLISFILMHVLCNAAIAQWNVSGTHIYNSNTGNVGIGTSSPTAKLEINLSAGGSGQNQGLRIWGGNSSNYFGNTQIAFSWGGGGAYSHALKTRHNAGALDGNAFDFYVWQPGDAVG